MAMNEKMLDRIHTNVGKVLFVVAMGRDLTKLEVKARASLSMSTVISAVDRLTAQELVTFEEERGPRGGKMRSVINVHPMRRVCGVSYKSGVLTALMADLKGTPRETLSQEAEEDPARSVLSLLLALFDRAPKPSSIALSLNCQNKEELLKSLEDRFGIPVLSATNTAAIAYLSLWKGATLPIAAVGVGNAIKCAFLGANDCRNIDLGGLPASAILTEQRTLRSVLSAVTVEETLRRSDYRGQYYMREGCPAEVKDLATYSRSLSKELALLVDTVQTILAPQDLVLFGDYLSEAFFQRIREDARVSDPVYFAPERADFAEGTALFALTERFFN